MCFTQMCTYKTMSWEEGILSVLGNIWHVQGKGREGPTPQPEVSYVFYLRDI